MLLCVAELQHQLSKAIYKVPAKTSTAFLCLQAPVKHKYGAVVLCKVSVKFSGAEDLRLLSYTFTLTGENARAGLMTAGNAEPILLCISCLMQLTADTLTYCCCFRYEWENLVLFSDV